MNTWYNILEVTQNASLKEIRDSYKRLALKFHPDKNNGDDTRFKIILNAYEKRLCQITYSNEYRFSEKQETLEMVEYLLNLRKLNEKITIPVLKRLVDKYDICPFIKCKSSYIEVIFLRVSQETLINKLKELNLDTSGDKKTLVERFLFGQEPKTR